ncbi:O-antigen flippase Wzx [hydrothermal vent metagenome]|uniref:O-antigen flippase Wzx n=1 Tax=hydrothermal vent metagenome TaxID=652676 RepID=A0A1W1BBZ5_9ZZZZ
MTGTTIAQAIPIAISPILTRIYTPEDFGVFALYVSLASVMSVVATGRYELAIMLPKKDEDAMNVVVLSIAIAFLVSLISLVIVSVFNESITGLLGNPEISKWLYFIPLTVLLTGMYQSFNYWLNRKKYYKKLAEGKIWRSGTTTVTNLGMGFGYTGCSGLIVGSVFGQVFATFILGKLVWISYLNKMIHIDRYRIFTLFKKYKNFPIFNVPNALIDAVRLSGINILIARFFTVGILGQFSLAWKMVQVPVSLLGGSMAQVFFQEISQTQDVQLYEKVIRFLKKSFLAALPIFITIYLFAPEIFSFVFGEKWKLAGEAASVMAPWLFLNFMSMPLANIFIVMNRQEIVLGVSIVYMLVPLSVIFFQHEYGFIYVLKTVTFMMSVVLLLYIGLVLNYTKKVAKNDL